LAIRTTSKITAFNLEPNFVDPEVGGSSPPNCTIFSKLSAAFEKWIRRAVDNCHWGVCGSILDFGGFPCISALS
jgi:hypothetical protein